MANKTFKTYTFILLRATRTHRKTATAARHTAGSSRAIQDATAPSAFRPPPRCRAASLARLPAPFTTRAVVACVRAFSPGDDAADAARYSLLLDLTHTCRPRVHLLPDAAGHCRSPVAIHLASCTGQ